MGIATIADPTAPPPQAYVVSFHFEPYSRGTAAPRLDKEKERIADACAGDGAPPWYQP